MFPDKSLFHLFQSCLFFANFEDSETYLLEKTVKKGGRRDGRTIGDVCGDGLVLLVKRDGEEIIPSGDTLLQAGDLLVILKAK